MYFFVCFLLFIKKVKDIKEKKKVKCLKVLNGTVVNFLRSPKRKVIFPLENIFLFQWLLFSLGGRGEGINAGSYRDLVILW